MVKEPYDEWLQGAKERVKILQDELLDGYYQDKEGTSTLLKVLQALMSNLEKKEAKLS